MTIDLLYKNLTPRMAALLLVFSGSLGLLTYRLWYEQVRLGEDHREAISKQSIRRIRLEPVRGRIYGDDGKLLTDNLPSYDVLFHIHELKRPGMGSNTHTLRYAWDLVKQVSTALQVPATVTRDDVRDAVLSDPLPRLTIIPALNTQQVQQATRLLTDVPGVVFVANARTHPRTSALAFELAAMRQPRRSGKAATLDYLMAEIERTAQIIRRPATVTRRELEEHWNVFPALPFRAFRGLSEEELSRLLEQMPGIPGMEVATGMERRYPLGEAGAHVLGYVSRRHPSSEVDRRDYNYYLAELHGRRGLERIFDEHMQGEGGVRLVRVNNTGFFYDDVAPIQEARMGDDIILTIDSRAQSIAQRLLRGKRGAMVVLHCHNGAVLAMASAPSFNLNTVTEDYAQLRRHVGKPLLNRALCAYAPGSIIKPLVALSMLHYDVRDAGAYLECPGHYEIGNSKIRCAHRSGHEPVAMRSGLEMSCNPYFINGGLAVGVDRLEVLLGRAGVGTRTGIELHSPFAQGILPARETLYHRERRRWNAFDTGLVSIGQGFITVTPLQAAVFTAAIANGGVVYQPHVVRAIRDHEGQLRTVTKPKMNSLLDVSDTHLDVVRQGMHRVVWGSRATAPAGRSVVIELAGKTGTAEVGSGPNKRKNTWFICFGPYDEPKYAVAVFIEDGVSGGQTAAPLARRFFDQFLTRDSS